MREGRVSVSVVGGRGRASACIVFRRGGSDSESVICWDILSLINKTQDIYLCTSLCSVSLLVSLHVETETDLFYWAPLNSFHMKKKTDSSLRNVVFLNKKRSIYNIQNFDSYRINSFLFSFFS
jgi:hypothetical protein